jgi:hypothetical protein
MSRAFGNLLVTVSSSEVSSGMYCRVKGLSADVWGVRMVPDDGGSTSQKTILNFILAAVRTWNLALSLLVDATHFTQPTVMQMVKQSHSTPMEPQGERGCIAPTHSRPRHYMGWVVSVTARLRFTPGVKTPGTHWTQPTYSQPKLRPRVTMYWTGWRRSTVCRQSVNTFGKLFANTVCRQCL